MRSGIAHGGVPARRAAAAGALAVGVAIAEAELLAGLTGTVSLLDAVGGAAIALQPPGAKDVVVGLFGDADKAALGVAVVLGAVGLGAIVGVVADRSFRLGVVGFVLFGGLAAVAAARQPLVDPGTAVVAALLAVASGLLALRWLLARAATTVTLAASSTTEITHSDIWNRRRFLIASAGTLGGVIVGGSAGRILVGRDHPEGVVTSTRLPAAFLRAADPAPDQSLDTPGLPPIVTPADRLYRIDIALSVPQVDVAQWRLEVTGMVDHPLTLTYDDLLAMRLYEQYVTIACVSNQVGGHLIGNPLWTGVRLKDVLAEAGVQLGATQVMGRSWSDFSVGFPTDWALAPGREPMIAVGMDRDVLPAEHGFPARLVVPGLYGYVSATKWLTQIVLTTREAQDGFWVPLGWAKDGPILTQSRIDVPAYGARLAAGPGTVAGMAWAGDRGVSAVEVRVDGGPWQAARVSVPLAAASWVQWSAPWTATPGEHAIEVRAADGTGAVQTGEITPPAPDGAHGYHRVVVTVG